MSRLPPVVTDWRSCVHPEDRRVHASFQRGRKQSPGAPISGWYCLDCGLNIGHPAHVVIGGPTLQGLREITAAARESTKRGEPGDNPDA